MDASRTYALPLALGVQRIRLDEDSMDYDWKGSNHDFHGTLPYENLRLKARVERAQKLFAEFAMGAVLIGGMAVAAGLFYAANFAIVGGGVTMTTVSLHFFRKHLLGRTIAVQIEPRPFGFNGELNVPNTEDGRKFLEALELAWKTSLKRRLLVADQPESDLLRRIGWLESIGVLAAEEAAAERLMVRPGVDDPFAAIKSLAVN